MIDEKKLLEALEEKAFEANLVVGEHSAFLKVVGFGNVKRIIERQPKVGEWIPCDERLPEDEENVLVWFEYFRYGNYNRLYQTIGISYTWDGEWSGFVNGESGWKQLKILAWMPLPEPYKRTEQPAWKESMMQHFTKVE